MIRPRGFPGIAFGEAVDGDPRSDVSVRSTFSQRLGIPDSWAIVDQVHGSTVVNSAEAGHLGRADGILTRVPMLPIAIATADCVPVVLVGAESVAIVHAGWRGVAAGVITQASRMMSRTGDSVLRAAIGPHIQACCYEVGVEVVDAIGGHGATTTSGTLSVDLASAIREQLSDVDVVGSAACTMHDDRFHSYRQNATSKRQVTVAWIPQD